MRERFSSSRRSERFCGARRLLQSLQQEAGRHVLSCRYGSGAFWRKCWRECLRCECSGELWCARQTLRGQSQTTVSCLAAVQVASRRKVKYLERSVKRGIAGVCSLLHVCGWLPHSSLLVWSAVITFISVCHRFHSQRNCMPLAAIGGSSFSTSERINP